MSKTRASCFIRSSRHLETIKAVGLRPRAFICFSVSEIPDKTLALVLTYYVDFRYTLPRILQKWLEHFSKLTVDFRYTLPMIQQEWLEHYYCKLTVDFRYTLPRLILCNADNKSSGNKETQHDPARLIVCEIFWEKSWLSRVLTQNRIVQNNYF